MKQNKNLGVSYIRIGAIFLLLFIVLGKLRGKIEDNLMNMLSIALLFFSFIFLGIGIKKMAKKDEEMKKNLKTDLYVFIAWFTVIILIMILVKDLQISLLLLIFVFIAGGIYFTYKRYFYLYTWNQRVKRKWSKMKKSEKYSFIIKILLAIVLGLLIWYLLKSF